MDIYVDADACPVTDEVYRVAQRHGLKVFLAANSWLRTPTAPWLRLVVIDSKELHAVDDWITDNIGDALATRQLLSQLRDQGIMMGGPVPFEKRDRSRFLQALDEAVQGIRHSGQ